MKLDDTIDPLFKELPLVIEGESKEVRYLGRGEVLIRFKPTVYSFTHNRCSVVPGSHIPRLRASKIFLETLRQKQIKHAYIDVGSKYVRAKLVMPHVKEFQKYQIKEFVPKDLSSDEISSLPKAPPIEVIVKRYLTGSTKHGCVGLAGSTVRKSHPFYADMPLDANGSLPEMLVRFDWRNPLSFPQRGEMVQQIFGESVVQEEVVERVKNYVSRIADTVLPTQLADLFIDVNQAQHTAYMTALVLEDFLAKHNIVFYDLCLFIDESGEMIYGEISPDCGRYRHLDYGSLDKDVWRSGGSSDDVISKWNLLVNLLSEGN